jgi:hypothetical protein
VYTEMRSLGASAVFVYSKCSRVLAEILIGGLSSMLAGTDLAWWTTWS